MPYITLRSQQTSPRTIEYIQALSIDLLLHPSSLHHQWWAIASRKIEWFMMQAAFCFSKCWHVQHEFVYCAFELNQERQSKAMDLTTRSYIYIIKLLKKRIHNGRATWTVTSSLSSSLTLSKASPTDGPEVCIMTIN